MSGIATRREFMGALGATVAAASCATSIAGGQHAAAKPADVGPGEDLMREHGVLRRVMMIYDEAIRRLTAGEEVPQESISGGAGIIRRVIEDYHEKLEEQFLFPRLVKAGLLIDLVATLRAQHDAGRRLTDMHLALSRSHWRGEGDRSALIGALQSFNRMYRPHAAREDTILFPAFHNLLGEKEYDALGDAFEDQEKRVLGASGFEGAVAEVAKIEETLGIYELSKFTP